MVLTVFGSDCSSTRLLGSNFPPCPVFADQSNPQHVEARFGKLIVVDGDVGVDGKSPTPTGNFSGLKCLLYNRKAGGRLAGAFADGGGRGATFGPVQILLLVVVKFNRHPLLTSISILVLCSLSYLALTFGPTYKTEQCRAFGQKEAPFKFMTRAFGLCP